jgi:hypothetical protein
MALSVAEDREPAVAVDMVLAAVEERRPLEHYSHLETENYVP